MGVQSEVKALMDKFKSEESGIDEKLFKVNSVKKRSIAAQVGFISNRPKGYPSTAKAFKAHFSKDMPKEKDLSEEEHKWLSDRVKKLADAGKAFYHCSGKAIDVGVSGLTLEQKKKFKAMLEKKFKLIMEKPPKYHVSIGAATVFHAQPKKAAE